MKIDQPQLFIKKLATLLGVTIVLVPLIHYKLLIPTLFYVAALLAIHIYIFYIYLMRINWRRLRANRTGFTLRLLGIVTFAYMLTLLHYQGTTLIVLLSIGAAVGIHAAILLLLMTRRNSPANLNPD